jgi:hypothetical protein
MFWRFGNYNILKIFKNSNINKPNTQHRLQLLQIIDYIPNKKCLHNSLAEWTNALLKQKFCGPSHGERVALAPTNRTKMKQQSVNLVINIKSPLTCKHINFILRK